MTTGIRISRCSGTLLEGNTIVGCDVGIDVESSTGTVVKGNTVTGNPSEVTKENEARPIETSPVKSSWRNYLKDTTAVTSLGNGSLKLAQGLKDLF